MSWAEEQDWFGLEDLALEVEENTMNPKDLIKQGYWLQADLEPIKLSSMSYKHLCNCINMIENGRLKRKWALPYLKKEQRNRLEQWQH